MIPTIERLDFPITVFRGKGALHSLGTFCKTLGTNALVFGGQTALAKTQELIWDSLSQAGVGITDTECYGGESSPRNINVLVKKVRQAQADVLIAVGGGKALDTGKLVANICELPLITVPTIAATCAAITPVSVVYTDDGEFVETVAFENCPAGTIIDTNIILHAPLCWLAAGIGDTLAKWYECRVSIQCAQQTSLTFCALEKGYELVERFGGQERQAVENRKHNDALDWTVDAIILYAGLASSLGGEKIPSTAAHAAGHGLAVGYGNLFLLALENCSDEEIREAMHIAEQCAVPTNLDQIVNLTEAELQTVAQAIMLTFDMKNKLFAATEDMVLKAIQRVNCLARAVSVTERHYRKEMA